MAILQLLHFYYCTGMGQKEAFQLVPCQGLVVLNGPIDSVDLAEVVRRPQWEVFLGEFQFCYSTGSGMPVFNLLESILCVIQYNSHLYFLKGEQLCILFANMRKTGYCNCLHSKAVQPTQIHNVLSRLYFYDLIVRFKDTYLCSFSVPKV